MKYNELKNIHGNNKGDIMNRYPKMKNNNGIIYGPEAGNGIAYVPEVYVDERKGLTTSFGVPKMGSQNRGYAVTKDPALKFRKYSNTEHRIVIINKCACDIVLCILCRLTM